MGQIFSRRADFLFRCLVWTLAGVFCLLLVAAYLWSGSGYQARIGVIIPQPVSMNHKIHVGDYGMDCRYCHTGAERGVFAGIPSTEICMQCHNEILKDDPRIAPIAQSYESGDPIAWTRVSDLPDYVYFDHGIHTTKGVACQTCHGRVDQMDVTYRAKAFTMGWCLRCHRDPAPWQGPVEDVFKMDARGDWPRRGAVLMSSGRPLGTVPDSQSEPLGTVSSTDCTVCHR
ncbi:MAG: cytochrome c3 family protein [Candidatus Omnitrophica bacterium]|nr:cytochrome c3 family protein [Candidatus Omnitrophota bacterium]